MKKVLCYGALWCALFFGGTIAWSQESRIRYNNQDLFLSGANVAWIAFANDIGPAQTDFNSFAEMFLTVHDNGGNAMRLWLHTNGVNTPAFDAAGRVIGPGEDAISDLKQILDLAWEREVGLKLCLWSFDMLRSSNNAAVLSRNRMMLTDTSYTHAYINNALIPMVDSLKGHPGIIAWEIFNEPEGMSNEFGWSDIGHVPMSDIQRFVNLCAGAIHRIDNAALVTSGAWSFRALTDVSTVSLPKADSDLSQLSFAEKQQIATEFNQKYRLLQSVDEVMSDLQRISNAANFNYYSDSRLIAAGGDPDGTLDFYSVHYYSGILPRNPTSISPFHHPASYWQLDKPILAAEFAMQNTYGVAKQALFDTLYQKGYAGALAWSWSDENFSTQEDMRAAMQYLWHRYREDVDIDGISGDWPFVIIVSPAIDAVFPEGAEVTIEAAAFDNDGTVVSVEFFASDTLKIGETTTEPYTITWRNIPSNIYTLTAIATDDRGHKRTSNRVPILVGSPPFVRIEAESATREGDLTNLIIEANPIASNGAYLEMRTQSGTITWQLQGVPEAGSYDIGFGYRLSFDSPKYQYINVNGVRVTELAFDGNLNVWLEKKLNVNLVQGTNEIQMQLSWGWMDLDYLVVPRGFIVSVEDPAELPVSFSLQQNYPNPFNPATTIKYSLARPEHVKLSVYDVHGRRVKLLIDERQTTGAHEISFDGRNFASGVYFYRLKAGAFVEEKRMMLLK